MKHLIPLVLLTGCIAKPIVQAPIEIKVDYITHPEVSKVETDYVPTVTWHYEQIIDDPEVAEDLILTGNDHKDDVYVFGAIRASFSSDGNRLRLDCSDGISAQYLCLAGDTAATMVAECGRMKFKVVCNKQ